MNEYTKITNCVFKYDTLVFYDETVKGCKNDALNNIDMDALREKRFNGKFSDSSQKSCKTIIKRWLSSYEVYINSSKSIYQKNQKRLVFLTLTLPAQQIHPDQTIKRVCFDNFLKKLKKDYGLINYVWKSELQSNYNIHFHLIIDCYADKKKVRKDWEQSLELLGYMTRFKNKHNNKTTRTTQIEAIRDNKMMCLYISKYMSKDDIVINPMGRIWGCSDKLRELTDFNCSASDVDNDFIEQIRKQKFNKFIYDEFFTVIYAGSSLFSIMKASNLYLKYHSFLIDNWAFLYSD